MLCLVMCARASQTASALFHAPRPPLSITRSAGRDRLPFGRSKARRSTQVLWRAAVEHLMNTKTKQVTRAGGIRAQPFHRKSLLPGFNLTRPRHA